MAVHHEHEDPEIFDLLALRILALECPQAHIGWVSLVFPRDHACAHSMRRGNCEIGRGLSHYSTRICAESVNFGLSIWLKSLTSLIVYG
jgi:hypothetical protein